MKSRNWILFVVTLILIGGTAGALAWLRGHQRLGQPGIRATAINGAVGMKIELPEAVAGFISTNVPEPEVVLGYLPKDTSYAQRIYTAPDGMQISGTVILMGADRTSIHNADFCLRGQGLNPDVKSVAEIPITGAATYSLPVARWDVNGTFQMPDGQKVKAYGVYVFWFVTKGRQTPSHFDMMKGLATNLLRTGELQRWAYVSYFAQCAPGQEDATFERMKNLIAHSVPEYQLPPDAAETVAKR